MPLLVNLRHLANQNLFLKGQIPVAELDLGVQDDLIHPAEPLEYDLEAQLMDQSLLLQGEITLTLDCECARCLKSFKKRLELAGWACDIPLEGDEKPPIISDCVDLTPYLREDILLEFPQHPLCDGNCAGLTKSSKIKPGTKGRTKESSSAWGELDKLKL